MMFNSVVITISPVDLYPNMSVGIRKRGFIINLTKDDTFKKTNFSYAVIMDVNIPNGNETARLRDANISKFFTVTISFSVSPLAKKTFALNAKNTPKQKVNKAIPK